MNRINQLFNTKKSNILSVYFTAGFPTLDATRSIIVELERAGVDMIEVGMPFSDPLADGPVIQNSSSIALANGMSLRTLFSQLQNIRESVSIPLVLMGYVNPIMQYGYESFCASCAEVGIDGLIIPDLPLPEYQKELKPFLQKYGLKNVFLISPQTTEQRISLIDQESDSFIYAVSSAGTTGSKGSFSDESIEYFNRLNAMKLHNPVMVGFGISNKTTFNQVCRHANGAIIGSAYINTIKDSSDFATSTKAFVTSITS